jgi:hypothetical protein
MTDANGWRYDMENAPRGAVKVESREINGKTYEIERHVPALIIAGGRCGVVTLSRWLPDQGRWNMFSKDAPPIAWQPWPGPAPLPRRCCDG